MLYFVWYLVFIAELLLITSCLPCQEGGPADAEGIVKRIGGHVERRDGSPAGPIIGVFVIGQEIGDTQLEFLKTLPDLESLYLASSTMTYTALAHIGGIRG